MATTQQHPTDHIIPTSTEEKLVEPDKKKEQHISTKNGRMVSPPSQNVALGPVKDAANQSESFVSGEDRTVHPPSIYAPQAHAVYYKGYDNSPGEWNEYPPYVNVEGLDMGSPGIYNDNPLLFHTGYGYSPQMQYGPYSPATTPLPSVGGDAQLYTHQQYPFSGPPYYQQVVPPSMPYITSPTPVSQPELNTLVNIDQQVDGMLYGPRHSYLSPVGTFCRGSFSGNSGMQDLPQGFDSFRYDGLLSNWPKPSDRQLSATQLFPSVSPQTIGTFGSLGQNVASPQPRSFIGFGSGTNSYNRGYMHGGWNQASSFGGSSISSLGTNGKAWFALENSRRHGRGSGSLCSCGGTFDILSEQNRGPRSSKPKNPNTNDNNPSADGSKHNPSSAKIHESYNHPDFVTEYKDAKFFIIKSYSEDNVHKSIKYGVWASTPNGNRKLDAAYREGKDKSSNCPVFLLFSVNASAQFCGVAEMIGPVDFDKSVDFWQQDKWSGQFPVKWHLIKDVPNSQFRHIVLENNDHKPVTNSRDTQEVKLEHGIEVLNIFKNYKADMSILDDFDFYEERQKAMEERKAKQQGNVVSVGMIGGTENRNVVTVPNNFIKQMSKSFAHVVRLDESGKEGSVNDRAGSVSDGSMSARVEDTLSAVVSNAQTN